MKNKFLVALDIDGTVTDETGFISDELKIAIKAAKKVGHKITIATGRPVGATLPVARELNIKPKYIICSNGAVTLSKDPAAPDGYKWAYVETFNPSDVLQRIRPKLLKASYAVEDNRGKFYYTDSFPTTSMSGKGKQVKFEELTRINATRVVVVSPEHESEEFLQIVEKMGLSQVSYAIGWTAWMDIGPVGVNKATALKRVASLYGFDAEHVAAVGDGRNDTEMLKWAKRLGRSAAMGSAPDDVKAAAGEVIPDVNNNGVAKFLISLPGVEAEIASIKL